MSYLSTRNPLVILTTSVLLAACASAPTGETMPQHHASSTSTVGDDTPHVVPASPALESESRSESDGLVVTSPQPSAVQTVEEHQVQPEERVTEPQAQTKIAPPPESGGKQAKAVNVICPIEGGVAVEEVTSLYEGDVIGFCCEVCKKEWEGIAAPERKKLMKEALRLSR